MNVGDLVNFYSVFFSSAAEEYKNPGIIIDVDDSHRQMRYTVMWADGRVTNEHTGYLKKENESENR